MNQEVKVINGYHVKDEKAIRTYDTVALMKDDINLKEGQHVKTRGYYSVNDGGSAEYYITNTSSELDYQENLNNELYATLIIENEANVKQFGAYGDSTHDDTEIIQYAFNYAKDKNYQCNVIIPEGKYLITNSLTLDIERVNLIGENAEFQSNISDSSPLLILIGGNDIAPNRRIENLLFRNINDTNTTDSIAIRIGYPTYDPSEAESPATHFVIRNCTFYSFGHCFILGNNAYIFQIEKCVTWNCKLCFEDYNQYLNNSGENIVIRDCLFTNYELAMKIRSASVQTRIENTSFDQGLKVLEYQSQAISYPCNELTFRDCHFESSEITTPLIELKSGDFLKLNILRCTSYLSVDNDYLIQTATGTGREFNINLENNVWNFYTNIPKYLTNSVRVHAINNLIPREHLLVNPESTNNLFINYNLGNTSISDGINKVNGQTEIVNKCWILYDGSTWNLATNRQTSTDVTLTLDNVNKPDGMVQSYKITSNNVKSRICYLAKPEITGTPVVGKIKLMFPATGTGNLIIQPSYYDGTNVNQIGIYDTTQTTINLANITPNQWIEINFPDDKSQIQHNAKYIGFNFILSEVNENFVYHFANAILQNI